MTRPPSIGISVSCIRPLQIVLFKSHLIQTILIWCGHLIQQMLNLESPPAKSCINSKPIKPTGTRRYTTLALRSMSVRGYFIVNSRLPRKTCNLARRGRIMQISPRLYIKFGKWVDLSEAAAIDVIAMNTSIPVPKI